jgi:septal ring factor EnvC (AmiA/AmiB activator)
LTTQSSQLQVLEEDKKEKDQVVKQLKAQEKDIAAQIKQRQRDKIRLRNAIDAAIKRAIAEAEKAQKEARKAQLAEKKRQTKKTKDDAITTVKSGGSKTPDAVENNTPSEPTSPTKAETSTANTNTPSETKKVVNREYSSFESTPENVKESIDFEKSRGRLPWPLDGGRIYGQFGRHKIEGTKLEADNDGIFIKTEVGATVKCVANGEVLKVFELDPYQAVMVKHGKYFTTYNMLSAVSVKEGDEVKAGTVLGKVAADLDGDGQFEFQVMNEKRVFQNPERWLRSR